MVVSGQIIYYAFPWQGGFKMRQKNALTIFLAVVTATFLLLSSTACEPSFPTPEGKSQSFDPSATPTTPPATPTPPSSKEDILSVEPEAEKVLTAAKADLMERLGMAEEAILVKSIEAVQWRDSSLGCPQPEMMYAQVITPGFRIVLTAEGKDYTYHTDFQCAVLCDRTDPSPTPISQPPQDGQEDFPIAAFDSSLFLFVEIKEERVSSPEGGQTTSFEGDMTSYRYNEETGTLTGKIALPIDDALRMVVGRLTRVRIGDNIASSGQLYAYPSESFPTLPIIFTKLESDGRLCFTYQDAEHCLEPGESVNLRVPETSSDGKSFPVPQKVTLEVINHGLLERANLAATP
jgi:hypothetical protein